jgi:DNA (cytosine-5)-methyltransferase 1
MKYLSVCSGVEAASVAWHSLAWKPVAFSEIEPFPSAVLAHHYKDVPNLGDMTKFKDWKLNESIDILVGGTPCQSFSVAGLRKGLEDPRGNLALTYVGILDKFRPKWFIWENVPGVLSSGGGRDFGAFLGAVAELGYGFAYRVLDAQNFGVPQRRRRVFVVGHLGDWQPAAKVLFESESLSGDSKPSRKTRKGVAGFVESSFGQYREDVIAGTTKASGGVLGGGSETFLTIPLNTMTILGRPSDNGRMGSGIGKNGDPCPTITKAHSHAVVYENHPSDSRVKDMGETCQTVTSTWGSGGGNVPFVQNVSYALQGAGATSQSGNGVGYKEEQSYTLNTTDVHGVAVAYDMKQHHNPQHTTNIQLTTGNCSTVRGDTPLIQNLMAVPYDLHGITSPTNAQNRENGDPCHTLARHSAAHASIVTNVGNPMLDTSNTDAIGVDTYNASTSGNVAVTLTASGNTSTNSGPKVMQNTSVRRLTPVECERLQGFPDNYTQIPWNKKVSVDCPDGLRYKAMGNSMAVPVMNWIGTRINNLTN